MVLNNGVFPSMREIVFCVLSDQPGRIEATAEDRPISITAASLEELHHEAREALIEHLGAAHGTFRVRIRRLAPAAPMPASRRRPVVCC